MAQANEIKGYYDENRKKRARLGKKTEELHMSVDEHGTVRFGTVALARALAAGRAAKIDLKKRKPSKEFEQELQNLEALSLMNQSDQSVASQGSKVLRVELAPRPGRPNGI